GAGRGRQRGPDGGEPAACLARVPPAGGDRDRAGERVGGLGLPGRPGRGSRATRSAGPVPHPAADGGRRRAAPAAQPLPRPGASGSRISVKREPHGAGSRFVHPRVHAGDVLQAAAPRGTFILQPGDSPVLLISAGVGATPVLAMLHALAGTRSGRDVWWLHGARNRAEEPFAAESRSLLARLASGHRYICYSRPGPADALGRDYQAEGRISMPVLAA